MFYQVIFMRFNRFLVVALAIWLSSFAGAFLPGVATPVQAAPLPAAPILSANSYILFDHDSGGVLASKDPDKRIEPASLTKMMTAYIVSAEIKRGSVELDEPVLISEKAQAMPGSRMFVVADTLVPLEDLLRGLIIQSGNDASVALAEHIAASEEGFVDMMNRTAQQLGMVSTRFANASGLPDEDHYTTANDLGKIASAIIREHPNTYKLYSERDFTYNDITQKNRNKLLWRDQSVDGMKTGHTQAAGYCLVASAVRDGMRLVSIVLGANSEKSRIAESQRLLNYGYRFYRTQRVFTAGEAVGTARIWMGKADDIRLGVAKDIYLTLPRDSFDVLKSKVEVTEYIRAPLRIGQQLGRSVLTVEDRIVEEVPLLALNAVEKGGVFKRMRHSIQRYFQ